MMNFKLFSTTVCLLVFVLISVHGAPSTPPSTKSAAQCATLINEIAKDTKIALLVEGTAFPDSVEKVSSICGLASKLHKQLFHYRECLTGLGRQVAVLLSRGVKKHARNYCSSKSKKENLVKEMNCYSNETNNKWTKCMIDADRQLEFAVRNSTEKFLLPNICCVYTAAIDCTKSSLEFRENCSKKPMNQRYFLRALNTLLQEVLDLVCGNFQQKKECAAKNPIGVQNIEKISKSGTKELDSGEFIVGPLIKGVDRLSTDDSKDSDN
ncbi:uncharacterized protein LOC141853282 [Brevipalpus obovatus]|uniref:uncharacterized protein LOC141853282 n=1 Tax=Brevipalpus obovatus TaxID=246614 RepID=UPI003D9FA535